MKSLLTFLLVFVIFDKVDAQNTAIKAGPMLGAVEMTEANLWVQTHEAVSVTIRYREKGTSDFLVKDVGNTTQDNSFVKHIKLEGLNHGSEYEYQVLINNEAVSFPYETDFKTQTLFQFRSDAPNFLITMGSCLYTNDAPDDRPGRPYGGNAGILQTIADMNPDIMLWLGDNVYYREPDFYSKQKLDYRNQDARDTPEMQELLATAINIASWDDHDYGPNDSDRSYRLKDDALDLFKRYWANPGYGTSETKGIFTRYKYHDVEFFITDDRYHRAPNRLQDPNKDFFGEGQLQWLKDALINSRAVFKFIVVGNQATNRATRHEGLINFPREYNDLMNYIEEQDIEGVIFLSGDRHFTELLKTNRGKNYPIYEFTSSPLTSGTFSNLDQTEEYNNPQRVDGTVVFKERNFGVLKVEGKRNERVLTMQTYNENKELLWEFVISEDDLKTNR